jgi:hypothetical protein
MIEKLNEVFDGLSPEFPQLVAYQDKINEIIFHVNELERTRGDDAWKTDPEFRVTLQTP